MAILLFEMLMDATRYANIFGGRTALGYAGIRIASGAVQKYSALPLPRRRLF
jgi:hypothetical protein